MKMNKLSIKISVYNCSVHLIISDDIEKVINQYVKKKKWLKEIAIEADNEVHGYAVTSGDTTNYYLFYSTQSLSITYITHEISHIVDYIFEEKELEKNGEARAYLTGYISEKVFDLILKKQLLLNKWYKPGNKVNLQTVNQIKNDEESN
jgi:hypothetical protein